MSPARKPSRSESIRPLSPAMEDYLKTIYALEQEHGSVTTQLLADWQGVTPASVTNMLKRLSEQRLVHYTRYKGVELTESGRKVAVEMVRHHRLLELYLNQALGFSWDEVHAEAERLEHFISEKLEERIDAALGYPKMDPHGSPIPALDGTIAEPPGQALSQIDSKKRQVVVRVADEDAGVLRRFAEVGMWPGVTLEVLGRSPQARKLRVGMRELELEEALCAGVYVQDALRDCGVRLSADQLPAGESGQVFRLRAGGERLKRLRGLGLEHGRRLRGGGGGERLSFATEAGEVELSRDEARCVLVEV